jgi:hypothetical protein
MTRPVGQVEVVVQVVLGLDLLRLAVFTESLW